ncbi:MAG: hypothetical protein WCC17_03680 [Candidatus Nitrosopolaris sp.]
MGRLQVLDCRVEQTLQSAGVIPKQTVEGADPFRYNAVNVIGYKRRYFNSIKDMFRRDRRKRWM